jgi:hypothetical protein
VLSFFTLRIGDPLVLLFASFNWQLWRLADLRHILEEAVPSSHVRVTELTLAHLVILLEENHANMAKGFKNLSTVRVQHVHVDSAGKECSAPPAVIPVQVQGPSEEMIDGIVQALLKVMGVVQEMKEEVVGLKPKSGEGVSRERSDEKVLRFGTELLKMRETLDDIRAQVKVGNAKVSTLSRQVEVWTPRLQAVGSGVDLTLVENLPSSISSESLDCIEMKLHHAVNVIQPFPKAFLEKSQSKGPPGSYR